MIDRLTAIRARAAFSIAALLFPTCAHAQETVTNSYDSRGRLVHVDHGTSGPNAGTSTSYTYDRADNRTLVVVATAGSACSGATFTIASNSAVTEGASSVFTVTKSGSPPSSCTVNYATANGTATAGSDYTAKSGTLTFTSAQATQTVSVATSDDSIVESPETFTMTLSAPANGGVLGTPASATATINDNDSAPTCSGVTFTIRSNAAVTEGTSSLFTVTKTGTALGTCTVNYATANGSAVAGSDYTAKSGTLTFTSTQASQSVSVATIDDGLVEATENFSMSLSSPTGGAVLGTPGSAVATINDNDGAGSCSGVSYVIGDAAGTEGDILSFSVTKSGSTSSSCSINYATADGTAIAGTNYLATSGTLTFTAAQTLGTVSVSTIDQSRLVGNKTMFVNLSGATGGAAISDGQGQGSIGPSGGGGGGQCNPVCP